MCLVLRVLLTWDRGAEGDARNQQVHFDLHHNKIAVLVLHGAKHIGGYDPALIWRSEHHS